MNPNSNKNIVIGIDVGYARLGIGLIEVDGSNLAHIYHDCLETPAKQKHSQRLITLKKKLESIIKKYKPQTAVVEDLYFFKNQKTIVRVGETRGMILVTLAEAGVTNIDQTPLQIKQSVTGYGRADKNQVQEMVKLLLKLKNIPKPDDAADALAAAIAGSNNLNLLEANLLN